MHAHQCPSLSRIHMFSLQLRLSKVVEGTRRLFLDLAEDGDVLTAQITPQSFYDGLIAKKVRHTCSLL